MTEDSEWVGRIDGEFFRSLPNIRSSIGGLPSRSNKRTAVAVGTAKIQRGFDSTLGSWYEIKDMRIKMVQYTPDTKQDNYTEASGNLCTETIESASRPLEGVDDIKSGDSLSLGVFGVCDRITDDLEKLLRKSCGQKPEYTNIFQKDLKDTTRLLINQAGDTLYATSASETTNGRLRNALDVIAENLTVTLGTTLSETLNYSQRP